MGVRTRADELRGQASVLVDELVRVLAELTTQDPGGWDQTSEECQAVFEDAFGTAFRMKKKLRDYAAYKDNYEVEVKERDW